MRRVSLKRVMKLDDRGIFRLFKLSWVVGEGPGKGVPDNYRRDIKFAFSKKPFSLKWQEQDKVLTFLFFRLTLEKDY